MSVPANSILDMLRNGLSTAVNGAQSPYLEPQEQAAVNAQRKQAMIAALLQSAAPRPQGTGNTLGDIGNALAAGNKAQGAGLDDAMKARLMALQIGQMRNQSIAEQARLAAAQAKGNEPIVVPPEGSLVSPTGQQLYRAPPKTQPPDISDAGKKVRDMEAYLGRKLTPAEALTIAGAGELFKPSAEELDKPLSPTDLTKLRLPDGSTLPMGTTGRQAATAGAKAYSDTELTRQVNVSTALNTLGELRDLAVGKDGVFVGNGGSPLTNNMLARLANGTNNAMGAFFGTQDSMRRDVFNSTAQGSISSLIRSLGDAGALSDGDVKRALSLIPVLGVSPDTEATAKLKFDELQKIVSRGANSLKSSGSSDQSDPLGLR